MKKLVVYCVAASLLTSPATAHSLEDPAMAMKPGLFLGARFKMSLGGSSKARPVGSLSLAPSRTNFSGKGAVSTHIGRGLAFELAPKEKPALTIAGMPARQALGLRVGKTADQQGKLGLSSTEWVLVGAGVVAAAAIGFALYVDEVEDNSD